MAQINLPSRPTQDAMVGKTLFISGKGTLTRDARRAVERMVERLKEIGGTLVTTDDPWGIDRYLVQYAAHRGVPGVVHGVGHRPRKQVPVSATYVRYIGTERNAEAGLRFFSRNVSAALSADQTVVIVSDPKRTDSAHKFVYRVNRERGCQVASIFKV